MSIECDNMSNVLDFTNANQIYCEVIRIALCVWIHLLNNLTIKRPKFVYESTDIDF